LNLNIYLQRTSSTIQYRCSFNNSHLIRCDFSNIVFNSIEFNGSTLDNCNFSGCHFGSVSFNSATLTDVDLTDCVFPNDTIFDTNTTLNGCFWRTSNPQENYIITKEFINFAIKQTFGPNIMNARRRFEEARIQPVQPVAVQPIRHQGLAYEVHNAYDDIMGPPDIDTNSDRTKRIEQILRIINIDGSRDYTSETDLINYINQEFRSTVKALLM
jgi:hypothetical protein